MQTTDFLLEFQGSQLRTRLVPLPRNTAAMDVHTPHLDGCLHEGLTRSSIAGPGKSGALPGPLFQAEVIRVLYFVLVSTLFSQVSLGGDAETAAFLSRLSSEREGTIPRRLHGVLHREMESLLRLLDYNNLLDRTCSHSPVPDALLFSARPPSAPQSSGSAPACASARDVTRASSAMHGPAPSSPGPTSPRHRACCSSSSASPCCSAPLPLLLSCSGGALDVGGDQQAGQEQHREKPTRSSDPSRSPSPKQVRKCLPFCPHNKALKALLLPLLVL